MALPSPNRLVRVHRFLTHTEAEGPGVRAALWVQGCSRHCQGCFNKESQNHDGGYTRTVDDLVFDILSHREELEGVTFVGGEPFEQAGPLAAIGTECKKSGLSVVTFTGHTYEELVSGQRQDWKALLDVTDLLLDGPFVLAECDTSRPWVGSRNQRFIFLTDRYRGLTERFKHMPNRLEIVVGADGSISLNGLAMPEEIEHARKEMTALGLSLKGTK